MATLKDGLGGEELASSGLQAGATNISPYFTGSVTGANFNGQVIDFGTFTGSGNTTVVSFSRTFTSTPVVQCFPDVGSVAVASLNVLSAIGTGSFSCAAGSNLAQSWTAIGLGTR